MDPASSQLPLFDFKLGFSIKAFTTSISRTKANTKKGRIITRNENYLCCSVQMQLSFFNLELLDCCSSCSNRFRSSICFCSSRIHPFPHDSDRFCYCWIVVWTGFGLWIGYCDHDTVIWCGFGFIPCVDEGFTLLWFDWLFLSQKRFKFEMKMMVLWLYEHENEGLVWFDSDDWILVGWWIRLLWKWM